MHALKSTLGPQPHSWAVAQANDIPQERATGAAVAHAVADFYTNSILSSFLLICSLVGSFVRGNWIGIVAVPAPVQQLFMRAQ
jgi:hypothetical protein